MDKFVGFLFQLVTSQPCICIMMLMTTILFLSLPMGSGLCTSCLSLQWHDLYTATHIADVFSPLCFFFFKIFSSLALPSSFSFLNLCKWIRWNRKTQGDPKESNSIISVRAESVHSKPFCSQKCLYTNANYMYINLNTDF